MQPAVVARLALVDGDPAAAIAPLRAAFELLRSRSYMFLASRERRLLSGLLVASSDVEGAIAELEEVVTESERLGMRLEARLACEGLARLGTTRCRPRRQCQPCSRLYERRMPLLTESAST
jgi:hypothetical protein